MSISATITFTHPAVRIINAIMVSTLLLISGAIFSSIPHAAHAQGVSFGPATPITGTVGDAEPPKIISSRENVYAIWHESPNQVNDYADIYLSRSTNRGNVFEDRRNLSDSPLANSDQEALAVSENNVYVLWVDNAEKIMLTNSTNKGTTFSLPKELIGTGKPMAPKIAASGQKVFVAWEAEGPLDSSGNPQTDIFLIQSNDAGVTFSDPINLSNNDGMSEFDDAVTHQITLSEKSVVVIWRDNTGKAAGYDIYVSHGQ